MKKFHRNLNIMSLFTAVLLGSVVVFWKFFIDIAVTNFVLNGIIIGTALFGIVLCFIEMFGLIPEYKWMNAYFMERPKNKFKPRLLSPIATALQNRHAQISTTTMSELLDLVSVRIEEKRDSVRYVTNTLIFLGLLGTFWGLIITVGSFADLILDINLSDDSVLETLQMGLAGPLTGMATAFTSSLLGLAGSLVVGFLGLQLQFAQNTIVEDLTDFMSLYVLKAPDANVKSITLAENAPVSERIYTIITQIYDAFTDAGYVVQDLIRIDGKYPAVVALGSNEKLFIGTVNVDNETLQNTLKKIDLCFADTLEAININTHILCVNGEKSGWGERVISFATLNALQKYLATHENVQPTSDEEKDAFAAYSEYIAIAMDYLFKPNK